jgi:predicted O-linked N-acetylglucosamine transferase (SPINDLY family)
MVGGRPGSAVPCHHEAVSRGRSGSLEAVIAEADAARAAGRLADAVQVYEAWIATDGTPARSAALFNLGVLRSDLGDLAGAAAAYAGALEIAPRLHQARINAGLVAERLQQDADAARHWLGVAEAVAQGQADAVPFATIALNHLGRLQEQRRHYAAAESALAHSLRLDPAQPDAIQHWVHLRQRQCTWPVLDPLPGLTVNKLMAATSPLAMLALLDDPAMQWLSALSFVTRKYRDMEGAAPPAPRAKGDRLRIGYLSGDLCTHAVGLLMAEVFEAHDRSRVHVTAFDFSPEDGTAHRARLRRAVDEMVPVHTLPDADAAQAIRERGIDVLVDMHGLSSGARPGILARRPAPLQGTYLGFIGTTALPWLDFVVTDRFTLPESTAPYVTERPLYIEGSMVPLFHQPIEGGRVSRESVGLPREAVVLASFNNIYKLTPAVYACWLRILQRCGRAVLWLLDDNEWATAALRTHASNAGIDPSRIVFSGRSTHAEFRERLALADLYLDTYPYNAGSTARDVLDALVPLVTLSGRTPVARMAGGLLHAAGLDALITTSFEAYEELAVQLAIDPARRLAIKEEMRRRAPGWRLGPARLARSLDDQLLAVSGGRL